MRLIPAHGGALSPSVAALVAKGLATAPKAPLTARMVRKLPAPLKLPRGVSVLQALLEEREEGR